MTRTFDDPDPTDALRAAKRVVRDHLAARDAAGPGDMAAALSRHTAPDWLWRGMHPWHTLHGPDAVAEAFWQPVLHAMGPVQRRPDIFLAGRNLMDGFASIWVVEMGHLMGDWTRDFLSIPAPRRLGFLRYAEFHRVEDGRIAETACFVDLPHLIQQTGRWPVPPLAPQTGAAILTPGPRTHDGLLYGPQDPAEGRATLDLITAMVDDLVGGSLTSPADHMDRFWTQDMGWFGPAGIGASGFRDGYRRGHSGPFEAGLQFDRHHGHVCRVGEGRFGGFFGYPSMSVRPTGGFMGLPAQDSPAEMRIVDLYRREGDRLAENWIFIDLLHFLDMQGLDILKKLETHPK